MENSKTSLGEGIRAYIAASGACSADDAWDLAARLRDSNLLVDRSAARAANAAALAIAALFADSSGDRVLLVAPSEKDVASLAAECAKLERLGGPRCALLGRESGSQAGGLSLGSIDAVATLSAAGALDVSGYGAVVLSDIDSMSDAASAVMARRALGSAARERRVIAFASDPGPSHRALARDLSGPFDEAALGVGSPSALPRRAIRIGAEDKPRLFASLIGRKPSAPVAVFCALRNTAEAAAKRLRSDGYRVDYIAGDLPRKRDIHGSVVSGERDVLVLTDEGAAGLPAAWASTLVNWDLPLDAESYTGRLAHLDRRAPSAAILDFVCERYELGVAAAERATGASVEIEEPRLDAAASQRAPAGAQKAPAETTGASAPGSAPASGDGRRPDRLGGKRDPKAGRDRGGAGEPRRHRGPRDDGERYDGRNARSIQANIAAITGGAAFKPSADQVAAPLIQAGQPEGGAQSGGKKRKRRGRKGKAQAEAGGSKPARQDPGARRQAEKAARGAVARPTGPGGRGPGREGDPYAISMEERLERYRARYGAPTGPREGKGGVQGPAGNGQSKARADSGRQGKGRRPEANRGPSRGAGPKPARPEGMAPGVSPGSPAAGAAPEPKGLFGVLRGLLGGGRGKPRD